MLITSAPKSLYISYLKCNFDLVLNNRKNKELISYYKLILFSNRIFSTDWFSRHIPSWLKLFNLHDLTNQNLKLLEIGSWEGMSSVFLLDTLKNSHLTCVDTWGGSDEHTALDFLDKLEERFDHNTKLYSSRLTKIKSSSLEYFYSSNNFKDIYDLIYVDGSHYSDDVIRDLIFAFSLLKPKGFLIIDDYLWKFYKNPYENPAGPINFFLKSKSAYLKIIYVNQQVIVQKISS